ncbi:MAG: hypothetical protein PHO66_06245 [Eubacteriales bacterium]|nr:hypothetical protein [Eubacteriales bacterium]
MARTKVKFIVYTALMTALAVVAQNLRMLPFLAPSQPYSSLVIGSLVNACLIVSACVVGWQGGLVVAVVTPAVALLQGQLPFALLLPLVAIGNFLYVALFYFFAKNLRFAWGRWVGGAFAAVMKFLFLFVTVAKLFVMFGLPEGSPAAKALSVNFSYAQLITALIGLALGCTVARLLKKANPRMDIL